MPAIYNVRPSFERVSGIETIVILEAKEKHVVTCMRQNMHATSSLLDV